MVVEVITLVDQDGRTIGTMIPIPEGWIYTFHNGSVFVPGDSEEYNET